MIVMKKIIVKESELRKLVLESTFKTMNVEENFHTLIDEWINSSQEGTDEIEEGVVDAYDLEDFANQNDMYYTYFYNMLDYLKNVYDDPNPYERMNDIIQDYVTSKSNVITEDTLKLVIKECIGKYINEISMDTLDNANQKAGINEEVLYAIKTIREEIEENFTNNKVAMSFLPQLDKMEQFFNRKDRQKQNFDDEFSNRRKNAEDRLNKTIADKYGENRLSKYGPYTHNDLDYDEWKELGNNLDPDDEDMRWAYDNY